MILISSLGFGQSVESKLYQEIENSFEKEGKNFSVILDEYESLLLQNKILKDNTAFSRMLFIHLVGQSKETGRLLPMSDTALDLQLQLSMDYLAGAIIKIQESDSLLFSNSSIAKVFQNLEKSPTNDRTNQNIVRDALSVLSREDWQHPFYRALTLFVAANFSDLHYRSSDQIFDTEEEYNSIKQGLTIEPRNVLGIKSNALGQHLIRGQRIIDSSGIAHHVEEFLTKNKSLSSAETKALIGDPSFEGYNFPFFSHYNETLTDKEIDKNRQLLFEEAMKESPDWQRYRYLDFVIEAWISKKRFFALTDADTHSEIHPMAHIRLISASEDKSVEFRDLNIILTEITRLRNEESIRVFGESYETILNRQNFFLNDALKLKYLELQYPVQILVNPQRIRSFQSTPPPAEEIQILPPLPKSTKEK